MLDLTATGMRSLFFARCTELLVFKFCCGLLVDAGGVVLHFALLADQVHTGALSSWHKFRVMG